MSVSCPPLRRGRRAEAGAISLLAAVALLCVAAPPAGAVSSPRVHVGTGAFAKFDQGGTGVKIRAGGVCSPGAVVLESFAYINQDGFSTDPAPVPLRCDGSLHGSWVLIPATDVPIHEGAASVSAYALVEDPGTGETAQSNWFREITILP
jgi:hypothetical protein